MAVLGLTRSFLLVQTVNRRINNMLANFELTVTTLQLSSVDLSRNRFAVVLCGFVHSIRTGGFNGTDHQTSRLSAACSTSCCH